MNQHAGLSAERWRAFALEQQLLMIGNEMHRATRLQGAVDGASRRLAYERVLRLVDLTVEVNERPALRRELLRWRDLAAALFLREDADPIGHRAALRAVLLLHPVAAAQVPFVLG